MEVKSLNENQGIRRRSERIRSRNNSPADPNKEPRRVKIAEQEQRSPNRSFQSALPISDSMKKALASKPLDKENCAASVLDCDEQQEDSGAGDLPQREQQYTQLELLNCLQLIKGGESMHSFTRAQPQNQSEALTDPVQTDGQKEPVTSADNALSPLVSTVFAIIFLFLTIVGLMTFIQKSAYE